ncbi:Uncharacterised protein [uncultured archaeon]|nr:Uncharacterised protein [uncultured archaeon]
MSDKEIPKGFLNGIRGTVRSVEKREISGPYQKKEDYISFRLEKMDESGNVIEQIPVEMRADFIKGQVIKDGDSVIVKGKRDREGLLRTDSVYIVETGLEMKAAPRMGILKFLLSIPFSFILMLSVVGFIAGIFVAISEPAGGILIIGVCVVIWAIFYLVYYRK